ncbi:hypothetical protein RHMOL_Rhmol01G0159100 [Rhododendron molle]|uniref:Uncharacterized protein n=1 Tax=Rhododendron molle TaxID=49168 RepID=A0ACC0Q276_RHOML|nr:hypothetical protein RHMOL_Rhmol01G0159100 [Rhododendron molle]
MLDVYKGLPVISLYCERGHEPLQLIYSDDNVDVPPVETNVVPLDDESHRANEGDHEVVDDIPMDKGVGEDEGEEDDPDYEVDEDEDEENEDDEDGSDYIADKYLDKLRDDPWMKVDAFQKQIRRELTVDVSKSQLYRANNKAKEMIEGDHSVQYGRLNDSVETVLKFSPSSWIKIQSDKPSPELPPTFCRMYVRYDAQLKGLLAGFRPIIRLDGAFLKGLYGGQILSAIGVDGNNNMFPIAIAVVEVETKES